MKSELRDGRAKRLVDCAKESFAKKGYYATTISEMAQQAGIARGTFYQYFDNKLHVFQSILDSFLVDLQSCIRPVALEPQAPSPLTQIEDNLTRVIDLVLREADLTQILVTHASIPDQAVQARLDRFYREVAQMIERSLNLGIQMSLVRRCNTHLVAYSIIGAVKEVVLQLTSTKAPPPPVDELVRELLDFGIGGIVSKPHAQLLKQHTRAGGLSSMSSLTSRA
jgi:AcrR family transcriptional regulator